MRRTLKNVGFGTENAERRVDKPVGLILAAPTPILTKRASGVALQDLQDSSVTPAIAGGFS